MVTVYELAKWWKQNILVANREGKNLFGRPAFSVRVSIKWYRKERVRDDVYCNFWFGMQSSFEILWRSHWIFYSIKSSKNYCKQVD